MDSLISKSGSSLDLIHMGWKAFCSILSAAFISALFLMVVHQWRHRVEMIDLWKFQGKSQLFFFFSGTETVLDF